MPVEERTHCNRGHEFTPENTRVMGDGRRRCRACRKISKRTSRQQQARERVKKVRSVAVLPFSTLRDRVLEGEDGCWLWPQPDPDRYARIRWQGATRTGHRLFYEQLVGPIPEGYHLHHRCQRKSCVNPAHLEAMTPAVHLQHGDTFQARNRRKTHCPQGHSYTPENTRWKTGKHGGRICRTCQREHSRRSRVKVS